MSLNLTLEQAQQLAQQHRVVPVIQTLFSGSETPLSVFEKLAANKPGSFLLESAEQGVWDRYSFIGVNNRGTLTQANDGFPDGKTSTVPVWTSATGATALPDGAPLSNRPLEALAQLQAAWTSPAIADVPPLTSGLVGLIGWDMVREIEHLPNVPTSDFKAPLMAFAMFQDAVVIDHRTSSLLLVSNIYVLDGADVAAGYAEAITRIDAMRSQLLQPSVGQIAELDLGGAVNAKHRVAEQDFLDSIDAAKHYIRIGDVFQVVISQRFDIEVKATALDIYRVLRALNPSPYMYLLNFEDQDGPYAVVGSSPEALVRVQDGHAITHPIAGSRPRSDNPEADQALADSLVGDAKERAEHLMLVDLARNDLLKVCQPGSVNVTEFMQIHRFSHIMHLVSTVEGDLRSGVNPVDVFRATFPAGTLSGAPKPRALEIIDELEESARGVYGGVVGYFDFAGNADLAIAIRTAFIRDGVARVQAGAGLVLDSVPATEFEETVNKAGAPARAVTAANGMVHLGR
jgi:anthranilate synthase component 1